MKKMIKITLPSTKKLITYGNIVIIRIKDEKIVRVYRRISIIILLRTLE